MVLYKVKEKANLFIHWSTCSNIYNVKFVLLSKSLLNHSERVNFNFDIIPFKVIEWKSSHSHLTLSKIEILQISLAKHLTVEAWKVNVI